MNRLKIVTRSSYPAVKQVEEVMDLFRDKNITHENILIPRSDKGLPMLPNGLTLLGNQLKTVTVYKNDLPSNYKKVDLNDFDLVVFNSPSCVFNFKTIYGDDIPSFEIPGQRR